jgi:hypothetical protein
MIDLSRWREKPELSLLTHRQVVDSEIRVRSAARCTCRPQKLPLRVSFRLVAEQSGARWHFSKRVFVMQATEDRFHEDERVRRQAVAVF